MNGVYISESNKIEGVYDLSEVMQSNKAWDYLKEVDALNFSEMFECHRLIMANLRSDIAGKLRKVNVWVGGRKCPNPGSVKRGLMMLLYKVPPTTALKALDWHITFEKIHPFEDGNGRTGRMIYWWHCKRLGLTPILFTAEHRQGYYSLFD